ncbi:MAG: NAD-dependent deacylase [Gammaproteobacteria bacterium]|nr:NAD-dependent deacylase [Gammaproteobacteria bacterium]
MKIDISLYQRIVILTGAGVSAASGLRTYRGPNGLWNDDDVQAYGHVDRLQDDPQKIWRVFGPLREQILHAEPNTAHLFLAKLDANLQPSQEFLLITQNVDGLHQQAGSRRVVELHGTIGRTRCANPDCILPPYPDPDPHLETVPYCSVCGSVLRPDIVLFGESLPVDASWQSKRALRDCDLFIAIGTSGTVSPAAQYVRSAEYAGARTVFVNLEAMTPPNPAFQELYLGAAEDVLPVLFDPNQKLRLLKMIDVSRNITVCNESKKI